MNHIIIMALANGEERYVISYVHTELGAVLETLSRLANDDGLSLSAHDAEFLSAKAKQHAQAILRDDLF